MYIFYQKKIENNILAAPGDFHVRFNREKDDRR